MPPGSALPCGLQWHQCSAPSRWGVRAGRWLDGACPTAAVLWSSVIYGAAMSSGTRGLEGVLVVRSSLQWASVAIAGFGVPG